MLKLLVKYKKKKSVADECTCELQVAKVTDKVDPSQNINTNNKQTVSSL